MDSDNWRVKRGPPADSPAMPEQKQRRYSDIDRASPSSFAQQRNVDWNNRRSTDEQSRGNFRKPLDKEKAEQTIDEGRRLWVGNLPYEATVKDVETLFSDVADHIEAVNMSVDPMTGRNPSYCFVDFKSKDRAENAMSEYNGRELLGRMVGVKPGVKHGTGQGPYHMRPHHVREQNNPRNRKPLFDRWNRQEIPEEISTAVEESRRLWIGSLPYFDSQKDSEAQISELLAGFNAQIISKVVSNHKILPGRHGNSNYCFVDFNTREEALRAKNALDGVKRFGGVLKVNYASGVPRKIGERERLHGDEPELQD